MEVPDEGALRTRKWVGMEGNVRAVDVPRT